MFPYLTILKKAWGLAIRNKWLWIFGLFIGGISSINLGTGNYFAVAEPSTQEVLQQIWLDSLGWFLANNEVFLVLLIVAVAVILVLLIVQGVAKGAVIWSVQQLTERDQAKQKRASFKNSILASRVFLWRIVGLHLLVTGAFFILIGLFLAPVSYLFVTGALGRAAILALLGLAIVIPAGLVFGFLHLYGPIFIVLYDQRIRGALSLSFGLIRRKFKESIVMAAFLLGLGVLLWLIIVFSLILFAIPFAILAFTVTWLELPAALWFLIAGAILVGFIYAIVLKAGFAVFHNMVWVLTVKELMVNERIEQEKKKALVAEPAA